MLCILYVTVQFNPFPLTTNQLQTTLKTSYQKHEKSLYMKIFFLTKVFKSRLLQMCQNASTSRKEKTDYDIFPHTYIHQTSWTQQKYGTLLYMKVKLLNILTLLQKEKLSFYQNAFRNCLQQINDNTSASGKWLKVFLYCIWYFLKL